MAEDGKNLIEPGAFNRKLAALVDTDTAVISAAISLKRIAGELDWDADNGNTASTLSNIAMALERIAVAAERLASVVEPKRVGQYGTDMPAIRTQRQ